MRWLLVSWGSHGDLHPFLSLGRELKLRGHEVTLVGHDDWTDEAVLSGVRFVSTGEAPRKSLLQDHPELLSRKWGGLASLRALVHHAIAPGFDHTMKTLLAEIPSHDVMVAHHFVFPAAAAAELTGIPWATVSLAPGVLPSAWGRPGGNFGHAGSGFRARMGNRIIWTVGRGLAGTIVDPVVNKFRAKHRLPPVRDAIFRPHANPLNLQLYSEHFAPRPPDWGKRIRYAGFCFYDPPGATTLTPETEKFLAQGETPILVTLGSAVVHNPGAFFGAAAEAIHALGLRGIFLTGPGDPPRLPGDVLTLPYARYGAIMPRVRAVIHQCGIGTLSHTLRAGVPSVACPFAFDQPNNARRLEALGVAQVMLPEQREAPHFGYALRRLLSGDAAARVRRLGELIRAENGPSRASEILESTFGETPVRNGLR